MPSKPNLLAVAALLALAAASSTVDAAPAKNGLRKKRDDRKLRRGRIATGTTPKRAARGHAAGRGGLEEDVAFWTNLVRRTQDLSVPNGGGGDQGGGGVGATPAPVGTTPTPPSPTPPPPTPPTPGTTITTPPVPVVGVICAQGETCTDVGDVCTDGTTEECCGEVFDSFVCECKAAGDVLSFDCGMTDACLNKVCDDDEPGVPPPPTPDTGGFNCPPAGIVGCTAVDPSNPVDECQNVGEPCPNANAGEFCCNDTCRKYCTAKQAPTARIKAAEFTETTTTQTPLTLDLQWDEVPDGSRN